MLSNISAMALEQLEIHDTSGKSVTLNDGIAITFLEDGVIGQSYGLHIHVIKEALAEYFERRKGSNKSFRLAS
jgi:hypothetical protein